MKKVLTVLFSGTIVISALTNSAIAQVATFATNINNTSSAFPGNTTAGGVLGASEVSNNALNDFSRKYKDASNVTWTSTEEVVSVYFTKNDVKMRSTYNNKGKWEYTIAYYNVTQAPKNIVTQINSNYYDKTIVQVTEIKRRTNTVYLVKMEDTTSFLTVRVMDGEIEFFEKINK